MHHPFWIGLFVGVVPWKVMKAMVTFDGETEWSFAREEPWLIFLIGLVGVLSSVLAAMLGEGFGWIAHHIPQHISISFC